MRASTSARVSSGCVSRERLADRRADRQARVQRAVRVLEDGLHRPAILAAAPRRPRRVHVAAAEEDAPAGRPLQAQDEPRGRASCRSRSRRPARASRRAAGRSPRRRPPSPCRPCGSGSVPRVTGKCLVSARASSTTSSPPSGGADAGSRRRRRRGAETTAAARRRDGRSAVTARKQRHEVVGVHGLERRDGLRGSAARPAGSAAAKRQPARQIGEVRRLALDGGERLAPAAERRQAVEEPDGIRMARPVEDLARPPRLHDAPAYMTATRSQSLATMPRSWVTKIIARSGLALDVLQEAQVLRLDRHVERGRRLVGDEQARLARDGDGAGHALADAAAHLVRVGVHAPLGIADPHLAQQLDARGRRARGRGSPRWSDSVSAI